MQYNVEATRKAPPPTNRTELQRFLGAVQYYAKFVPNLSKIWHPLYELLKVGVEWSWGSACDEVFNQWKRLLSRETVLTHYDESRPLILTTDARSFGILAVIRHQMPDGLEKPIEFASRTLSAAERICTQIELETLGIIYGVKKFHQYLMGRSFTTKTDHRPLTKIFGPKTGISSMANATLGICIIGTILCLAGECPCFRAVCHWLTYIGVSFSIITFVFDLFISTVIFTAFT